MKNLDFRLFCAFLKGKKLFSKFIYNVQNAKQPFDDLIDYSVLKNSPHLYLHMFSCSPHLYLHMFSWGNSNEGFEFWRKINIEWLEILCKIAYDEKDWYKWTICKNALSLYWR